MADKNGVLRVFDAHPDWTSTQIAAELKCGSSYVRTTLIRNGRTLKRTQRGRHMQDWEHRVFADAYISGEKLDAVAFEFGVHRSTVARSAWRQGCEHRGRW